MLGREISGGGQARIFEATQKSTGQKVALKLMREGPLATARNRARFDREVQILAALKHPNIVSVIDRGSTTDGTFFFAMEYVDGQPLDEWLEEFRRQHPPPDIPQEPAVLLTLFLKIADAVNAAHLRGVVHRDLKPANIMIDSDGAPRILDFGLARTALPQLTNEVEPKQVTITGQFIGSLPWASPEQAEGLHDKVDARTDVYALGVILYQMLTGQFPYEVVGNMRDVLDNIMRAEPAPPSTVIEARLTKHAHGQRRWRKKHRNPVNAVVEAIVLKALSKSRDRRYQTAGEFAADVGNYLTGRPTAAAGVPIPPWWRRTPTMIGAAAACVVLAVAITLYLARPASPPAEPTVLDPSTPPASSVATQPLAPAVQPTAPDRYTNSIGMKFIKIKAGEFDMGSPAHEDGRENDETQHRVRLTQGFLIGTMEVTQAQWKAVMGSNPSQFRGDSLPVEMVSWGDAGAFCRKLGEFEGREYRLPTEAEWEYACRAGTTGQYAGTGRLDDMGWCKDNGGRTHPVGYRQPNDWGLHDMHGNVWEWCSDWYEDYSSQMVTDPTGGASGDRRVFRGGSWFDAPEVCRSARRTAVGPGSRGPDLGFRVVLTIEASTVTPIIAGPWSPPVIDVPPLPAPITIARKAVAFEQGGAISAAALVRRPATIAGLNSWTVATRVPHGRTRMARFSPDGKLIALGGTDSIVRVLNAADGTVVAALPGPQRMIRSVSWSPTGAYLAANDWWGTMWIWNSRSWQLVRQINVFDTREVTYAVAWAPDGKTFAASQHSLLVRILNVETGAVRKIKAKDSIVSLAWLAGGRQLAGCGRGGTIYVWDVASCVEIRSFGLNTSADIAQRTGWSADGNKFAVLASDDVHLFDTDSGAQITRYNDVAKRGFYPVFSSDGSVVAFGGGDGAVLLDIATGQQRTLATNVGTETVVLSPDCSRLFCTDFNGALYFYDCSTGAMLWSARDKPTARFVQFSDDGKRLATGDDKVDQLRFWDTDKDLLIKNIRLPGDRLGNIAWSGDLLTTIDNGRVRIWDTDSYQVRHGPDEMQLTDGCHSFFPPLAWSDNGAMLAAGATNGMVNVWQRDFAAPPRRLSAGNKRIYHLSWSPSGKTLAAAVADEGIVLLDVASGRKLRTLPDSAPWAHVTCALGWASDGQTIAAVFSPQAPFTMQWRALTGERIGTKTRIHDWVCQFRHSQQPGGETLALATGWGVRLWKASSQETIGQLDEDYLYSTAWSGDGRLIDGAADTHVALWNAQTKKPHMTLVALDDGHFAVSPNGHYTGSDGVEDQIVYIARTDDDKYETLNPAQFATKYKWTNNQAAVGNNP